MRKEKVSKGEFALALLSHIWSYGMLTFKNFNYT